MPSYNPQVFVPAEVQPPANPMGLKVQALEAQLKFLTIERDSAFAMSLIKFYKQNDFLSDKQFFWVTKLLERIEAAQAAPPVITETLASGFVQVVELFARARAAGLSYPKIRLETEQGQKIILRQLGGQSKYPGQVSVTDSGQSYDSRKYFGRIDSTGVFYPSKINNPDITKLLQDLAADPAHMAALYGHKTSSCCFCGLHLETRESVAMGYGPICAQKYGLPWGHVAPPTYTKITL
ncbi:MAG: hypothetical protein NVS1B10_08400 [Candidatus Saccharimonadales bacterium]